MRVAATVGRTSINGHALPILFTRNDAVNDQGPVTGPEGRACTRQ